MSRPTPTRSTRTVTGWWWPLLYLHGLSTSDFAPALEQFLGSGAGLSASTITRLTTQWQDEAAAFNTRSLAGRDYVYMLSLIHI